MRVLILVVAAVLAACASAPREAETARTTDAAASPSSAPPATAANASSEDASRDTKRTFKPPAGWRAKIVDWEILYCRKGPVGGSHMVTELCMTEYQLKEHVAANDGMRRDLDQSSRICAKDGCSK